MANPSVTIILWHMDLCFWMAFYVHYSFFCRLTRVVFIFFGWVELLDYFCRIMVHRPDFKPTRGFSPWVRGLFVMHLLAHSMPLTEFTHRRRYFSPLLCFLLSFESLQLHRCLVAICLYIISRYISRFYCADFFKSAAACLRGYSSSEVVRQCREAALLSFDNMIYSVICAAYTHDRLMTSRRRLIEWIT